MGEEVGSLDHSCISKSIVKGHSPTVSTAVSRQPASGGYLGRISRGVAGGGGSVVHAALSIKSWASPGKQGNTVTGGRHDDRPDMASGSIKESIRLELELEPGSVSTQHCPQGRLCLR